VGQSAVFRSWSRDTGEISPENSVWVSLVDKTCGYA